MKHYYQVENYYPKLKNPHKYCGSVKKITLRSGWEITIAKTLDENPSVIEWSSEDFFILYDKITEQRKARYFIDFYVKFKTKNGIKEELWEIKPYKQTIPPIQKSKKTKSYLLEIKTFTDNQCKWEAAKQFCFNAKKQGKNISFRIITEFDIFPHKYNKKT
jgi:hypothetical protein